VGTIDFSHIFCYDSISQKKVLKTFSSYNEKKKGGTMKKFVLLLLTICLSFLMPMLAYSANTVSGVVVDSVSGKALEGVKVALVSLPCSTVTNNAGIFTLTIPTPTSVFHPAKIPKKVLTQEDKMTMDLRGCVVKTLSSGLRILKSSDGGVAKVIKLNSDKQSDYSIVNRKSIDNQVLFKSAGMAVYNLSAKKDGYNPSSKSVLAGQSAEIKLVPKGATGDFNLTVDGLGTLTITTEIK
jgi:hypothetical protein